MEISESMRRAGWRECPDDAARLSWELNGGRWQIMQWLYDGFTPAYIRNPDPRYAHLGLLDCEIKGAWRPVNPETWDYDPRGWGEQPAPVVKFSLWWRVDQPLPVRVYDKDGKSFWTELDDVACVHGRPVEPDEKWAIPCTLPAPAIPAPVVPDRAGWWWRRNYRDDGITPVSVFVGSDKPMADQALIGKLCYWDDTGYNSQNIVYDDGRWLGPCVKPEASNV